MAQTGYTPIQLYYSTTASAVPTNTNLANGELAINITDGKLYYKDNTGTVKLLTSTGSEISPITNNGVVYVNSSGQATSGSALTFNGSKLEVSSSGEQIKLTSSGDFSSTGTGYLRFYDSVGAKGYVGYGGTASRFDINTGSSMNLNMNAVGGTMTFQISNTEQMRLTSTGLGIGTSSPLAKLNVVTTGGKSTIAIGDTALSTYSQLLMYGGSGKYNWSLGAQYNVNNAFEITPSTTAGGTTFSTPAFVIDTASNVGIGTSSPASKLQVTSANGAVTLDSGTGESHYIDITHKGSYSDLGGIRFNQGSTTYGNNQILFRAMDSGGTVQTVMTLNGAGNLGLGRTPVAYSSFKVLDVAGSAGAIQKWVHTGSTVELQAYASSGLTGIGSATNHDLILVTNDTERFRITSAGALGIGSTPSYGSSGQVLTSNGSGAAPSWQAGGGGGSAATPTALGTVYGNTGSGTPYNVLLGYNAGGAISTGAYHTAVGFEALKSNVTVNFNSAFGFRSLRDTTSGASNSAVGYASLIQNTTGSSNVAVGDSALYSNTTASGNTAVGYQAGYTNATGGYMTAVGYQAAYSSTGNFTTAVGYQALYTTTGTENTAVGYFALKANTTGADSTAVGMQALQSNTTGGNNSAFGYLALGANTTGIQNNAFGALSLSSTTTASYSDAFGYTALRYNTGTGNVAFGNAALRGVNGSSTGGGNSGFGASALLGLTSGQYNVAIGQSALQANTTASNNTAVGYQAGYGVTTGQNNILIGSQTGIGTITGNFNVLTIPGGNGANITGSKNVSYGHKALLSLTSGSANTAIGPSESGVDLGNLQSCSTGGGNVAMGQGNLGRVTTGGSNVALGGNNLGTQITTGNNNLLIAPTQAGYSLTTAESNCFIGTYPGGGAGFAPGYYNTGSYNTILAAWNGNQDSLDLRTSNSQVVIGAQNGNWGMRLDATSTGNSWYQRSNSSSWATTSDRRIKTNFKPVTNGLEIINALKPTEFDYIIGGQHDVSFIAQEYEEVLPDQVVQDVENKDEAIMALTGGEPIKILRKNLDPYLVSAIQSLTTQIEQLKAEIATFKGA